MKTERLTIKLEPEKLEKLKEKADRLGLSMSAYVRFLVSKDLEHEQQPTPKANE
jgi:predicted DNA binding CopG/RHH family protein